MSDSINATRSRLIPPPVKDRLQYWSRNFLADKLRDEGFISYNNEDLSWYRIVNGELLHTVYLFTKTARAWAFAEIGFGVHPLFIPAPIPQKCVVTDWWENEVLTGYLHRGSWTSIPGEPYLVAPATKLCGAENLDTGVFSWFRRCQTLEKSYAMYKKRYLHPETSRISPSLRPGASEHSGVTLPFIDCAIYLNDSDIFSYCIHDLNRRNMTYHKKNQEKKEAQLKALCGGEHEKNI